ncbi:flagellar assembly protein FliW [Gorillibacterium massiliense]|uniref:flagellar assembly protein FliW n=1 Tax=Gorillibacterium massiliense TaxID=1280390 RepID=UPI0004B628FF|nr:flagellar assembly protein FliW [Gorillibacterium massiliense]
MLIQSSAYGTISVTDEQVFAFESGIVGIPEIREYAILPFQDTSFFILHALSGDVSFILLPASQAAIPDYSFELSDEAAERLLAKDPRDLEVFLIVNAQEDRLYVNLLAPILLSATVRKGYQYVITDKAYAIRHPLVAEGGE